MTQTEIIAADDRAMWATEMAMKLLPALVSHYTANDTHTFATALRGYAEAIHQIAFDVEMHQPR